MNKIFEVKGADLLKGLSLQGNLAYGGLFKILQNIDPFEQIGALLPSLLPTLVSTGTLIKFLKSWDSAGTGYLYGQSDSKLYQILKDSPFTVSDQTAQILQGSITGTPNGVIGSAVWGTGSNKYIYAFKTSTNNHYIHSNVLPVASGSDTDITPSGFGQSAALDFVPFCIGANAALYTGDYQQVNVITSDSSTTGNVKAGNIDGGFTVRDIVSDGQYLVVIADNNAVSIGSRLPGKYRCRVYFWDMVTTSNSGQTISPVRVWDIDDSYLIGARYLDGGVYIFGYNGFYVCNVSTAPKMIRPFVGSSAYTLFPTGRPANPAQITSNKGSIFWLDGTASAQDSPIFAYGNPVTGQQKIFYQPYGNVGHNQTAGALIAVGAMFFASDNTTQLLAYNDANSTRGTARIVPTSITLSAPNTFAGTKVALASPLATGQTVSHSATSQTSTTVSGSETRSYNATKPKQTLFFRRNATAATTEKFEELQPSIIISGAAAVQRIAVYATPDDDTNEEL